MRCYICIRVNKIKASFLKELDRNNIDFHFILKRSKKLSPYLRAVYSFGELFFYVEEEVWDTLKWPSEIAAVGHAHSRQHKHDQS